MSSEEVLLEGEAASTIISATAANPGRNKPKCHPNHILLHSAEIDPKYLCSSCGFILKEPHQSYCGHRRVCCNLQGILRCIACVQEGTTDPEVLTLSLEKSFPDNATRRELSKLTVRCDYGGCPWQGKFQAYEEHEKVCTFRSWICDKCGTVILEAGKKDHTSKECPKRNIQCRYCKDVVEAGRMQFPIKCQLCDTFGKKLPREKMMEHQTSECDKIRVFCEFGCFEAVKKDTIDEHNQTQGLHHLNLLREKIAAIETKIQIRQQSELRDISSATLSLAKQSEGRIAKLEVDLKSLQTTAEGLRGSNTTDSRSAASAATAVSGSMEELKNATKALENKVNLYDNILGVLKMEVERVSTTMESFNRQRLTDKEAIDAQDRKIKSLERMLALKDVALAEQDLRIQSLELTSYDGTLLWKISDYSRKKHDGITGRVTSIYSPVFYTSRTGYKMCCRVYLNGDGMGKSSHISLFFVVMRGQYDALQRWPFRQKVTLMLLDQNNREHVIDAFRPDPNSSSFKRPTSEMNIASGCPLFMPLSQLDSSQQAYIRDDTVFIKVIVDTSDLN